MEPRSEHTDPHSPLTLVLGACTAFGTYSTGWFAVALLGLALDRSWTLLTFTAGIGLEFALVNGPIKSVIGRPRPPPRSYHLSRPAWLSTPRTSSFPSGHASASAFNAVIWSVIDPRAGAAAAVVAIGNCISRVAFGYHHASDVVGGLVVGSVLATIGCLAVGAVT